MEAAPSTCRRNLASSEYLIRVRRSLPFIATYVANAIVHHVCPGCSIETLSYTCLILFSLFFFYTFSSSASSFHRIFDMRARLDIELGTFIIFSSLSLIFPSLSVFQSVHHHRSCPYLFSCRKKYLGQRSNGVRLLAVSPRLICVSSFIFPLIPVAIHEDTRAKD